MKNLNEKSYDTVLSEASDFFAAQGISMVGEGYKEIATNAALFESYVDALTEGASADDAATMAQLMANTNSSILRESSMTGIQPVASLSMPVIRKLWPKFALKDALKTEVAKTPRFVVSYTKPYMFRAGAEGAEERVYLPMGIDKKELWGEKDALSKKYVAAPDVFVAVGTAAEVAFDTKVASTGSAIKVQPCDELVIVSAEFGTGAKESFSKEGEIKIGHRLGVYENAVYPFDGGQLIVQFDGKNCKAVFAALGKAVKLSVKAGVSTEFNEESWSVGFDIARQDIDIPTGQHLNAPLPIEALNDMMALYQIDGTKETVDLMTNVFAQKLDLEVISFLKDSWAHQPGNDAFGYMPSAQERAVVFDCKPAAGFAGSPKAWREEIKPLIDHLAQRIKSDTYLQAGVFTLVANPLDVQILANVDWSFRGGQGANMSGVDVDYSIGTYVGANAYKVIASTNVKAGVMYMIFTPSSESQMTYKYYPYSFSTEMGYVDPNRSRTPSIMMTKRHQFHEFLPAIGAIIIKNNDGKGYFNRYITATTREWVDSNSNGEADWAE